MRYYYYNPFTYYMNPILIAAAVTVLIKRKAYPQAETPASTD